MSRTGTIAVDFNMYTRLFNDAIEASQAAVVFREERDTLRSELRACQDQPATPAAVVATEGPDVGLLVGVGVLIALAIAGLVAGSSSLAAHATGEIPSRDEVTR